jgi:predicted nucleic acid-binding protein
MKKLRLYLETSVISAAIDDREPERKALTLRLFEEIKKEGHELFISDFVAGEVDDAFEKVAFKLRDVIKSLNPRELETTEEVKTLADKYVSEGIIPEKYRNDAYHIAIASVNGMDIVVSWNFEHMVKFKTKREVMGINIFMGYERIEIDSPLEVVKNVSGI